MPVIEKAFLSDFDEIFPLLKTIHDNNIPKATWKQLFINNWNAKEDYCGFKLIENGKIIGFMGLIFAEREINGKLVKFANRTSTVIQKDYRGKGYGRLLIESLNKLENYTITTFSGLNKTIKVLKSIGHEVFEDTDCFSFPLKFPFFTLLKKNRWDTSKDNIINKLDGDLKQICLDHKDFKCNFFLFESSEGSCLIIFNRIKKKGIWLGRIHFVSDWSIFYNNLQTITSIISVKFKIVAIFFPNIPRKNISPKLCLKYKLPNPRVFKSDVISRDELDSLYSELIILNL